MKRVALDFDGVLHPYTEGWVGKVPADEAPTAGSHQALVELTERGYEVVVFSARASTATGRAGIWDWLDRHGLRPFVADVTHEKPAAVAYVDDRAVPFRTDESLASWRRAILHVQMLTRPRVDVADPVPDA